MPCYKEHKETKRAFNSGDTKAIIGPEAGSPSPPLIGYAVAYIPFVSDPGSVKSFIFMGIVCLLSTRVYQGGHPSKGGRLI